jgi:hypothetical protein
MTSEELIKMWKVKDGQATDDGCSVVTIAHMTLWVRWSKNGCTRLAVASDKAYQLFTNGRWVSPDTPSSSATKTGRHDIAEILVKVALKHPQKNQKQTISSL